MSFIGCSYHTVVKYSYLYFHIEVEADVFLTENNLSLHFLQIHVSSLHIFSVHPSYVFFMILLDIVSKSWHGLSLCCTFQLLEETSRKLPLLKHGFDRNFIKISMAFVIQARVWFSLIDIYMVMRLFGRGMGVWWFHIM